MLGSMCDRKGPQKALTIFASQFQKERLIPAARNTQTLANHFLIGFRVYAFR